MSDSLLLDPQKIKPREADLDLAGDDLPEEPDQGQGIPEDSDEIDTILEMAKAFVDIGDMAGARDTLEEVPNEGDARQREGACTSDLRAPGDSHKTHAPSFRAERA